MSEYSEGGCVSERARFWGRDALDDVELAARWAAWSVEGVGPVIMSALLDVCDGELVRLWYDRPDWAGVRAPRRVVRALEGILDEGPSVWLERELERVSGDTQLLHIGHELYPPSLLDLDAPPCFITVRGDPVGLQLPRRLSVVGSRDVSVRHGEFAAAVVGELAATECVIISGGARGLDAIAHLAAVSRGAPTVAVMPGGLGRLAPRRNEELFEDIVDGGGVLLSEYPWDVAPRKHHYARRNHLIAALGQGLVVIRAGARSGTILSAAAATALERPICALPYDADDELAAGSRALIRGGRARLVSDAAEILEDVFGELRRERVVADRRDAQQQLGFVSSRAPEGGEWFDVDGFAASQGLSVAAARAELLRLELVGEVTLYPGGRYVWGAHRGR